MLLDVVSSRLLAVSQVLHTVAGPAHVLHE